jgi:hypothetical protein
MRPAVANAIATKPYMGMANMGTKPSVKLAS